MGEECSSGDPDPEVGAGESARASPSPGEDVQDEVRYGRSEKEGGSRGGLPDAEKDRQEQERPTKTVGRRRLAVAAVVGDGDNLIFRLLEHLWASPVLSDLPW